jgi:tRNA 2-thiocytidine biosynthesis protein TtcA
MDDFIETLLLNLFFSGSIKGMSPNLEADDRRNRIIRPLVYVREEMTREYARREALPLLNCSCPFHRVEGSRRTWVKSMLARIEKEIPDVRSNLLAAMGRVDHRHLLNFRDCSTAQVTRATERGVETGHVHRNSGSQRQNHDH